MRNAGTPALSVYKNSTTESTSGITLAVDYDSRTGMHHVVIDTSSDGTFYAQMTSVGKDMLDLRLDVLRAGPTLR